MKYVPPLGETGDAPWVNENTETGIEGSIITAPALEHPQREIINAIRAAGLVPDENDLTQLAQILAAKEDKILRLNAATTFYVRQDGSDDNDGLTPETAVRSFAQIYKILRALDSRGYAVTVDIGPGVWGGFTVPEGITISRLHLQGAGSELTTLSAPEMYGISHRATGCYIFIRKITLKECVYNLDVRYNATAFLDTDVNFGSATNLHMQASYGGVIAYNVSSDWRISGSAPTCAIARHSGVISLPHSTVTVEGSPHFSIAFARAEEGGVITLYDCVFDGIATGRRYYAATNGVITTSGKGEDYFPGNQDGETRHGGQYV